MVYPTPLFGLKTKVWIRLLRDGGVAISMCEALLFKMGICNAYFCVSSFPIENQISFELFDIWCIIAKLDFWVYCRYIHRHRTFYAVLIVILCTELPRVCQISTLPFEKRCWFTQLAALANPLTRLDLSEIFYMQVVCRFVIINILLFYWKFLL